MDQNRGRGSATETERQAQSEELDQQKIDVADTSSEVLFVPLSTSLYGDTLSGVRKFQPPDRPSGDVCSSHLPTKSTARTRPLFPSPRPTRGLVSASKLSSILS